MKKKVLAGVLLVLFASIVLSSVISASLWNKDFSEIPTEKELSDQSKAYLKKSLTSLVANTTTGKAITSSYEHNKGWLNPLFFYTLGMKPSLSWIFALALTLWICMVIWASRLFELFNIQMRGIKPLLTFIFAVIISVLRLAGFLSYYIIKAIGKLESTTMQGIAVLLIILAITFAGKITWAIKRSAEKTEEAQEKRKEKKEIKEMKQEQEEIKETIAEEQKEKVKKKVKKSKHGLSEEEEEEIKKEAEEDAEGFENIGEDEEE